MHTRHGVSSRKWLLNRILLAVACDGASARRCESQREVCEWLRPF